MANRQRIAAALDRIRELKAQEAELDRRDKRLRLEFEQQEARKNRAKSLLRMLDE